jgi:pSer/pThr/pTyr-binding forkhead associated (FHA) protein
MVAVFKKLFGRKETPINEGKSGSSSKVDGLRWVKKFILELSNMEGSPTYNLTHQLSVGSEVGNIVIADPSVSPRHCTFILQEDVVSVLDHGSMGGTFINGQKIPPGRYIILEDTDSIKVGDLEVKIHVKTEAIKQGIPDDELDEETEEEVDEEIEETEEEVEEKVDVKKASKLAFWKKWFKPKPKPEIKKEFKKAPAKSKVNFVAHSSYATNSIVRVIAVLCDSLIAYILYVIFSPFDEFQSFVNDVPVLLGTLLDINWDGLWAIVNEEYPFVVEMLKDFYTFFSVTLNLGPLFLLFVLIRLISTLMFGVSISEGFLGVKSYGNGFWKRVGGVLRVIIGIVTGPFLIFDTPAIVSRRTFKEFMTFTHTYVESKFITILGVILYLPVVAAIALLAPLGQGLELPEPIAVNDRLDKRVRVVQPTEATAEVVKNKDYSKFLNVEIELDAQKTTLVPFFEFSGEKKKLTYKPGLIIYHKDLQRTVELEVFKTFDFKELLAIGFKGDFFLESKFPQIEGFIHASGLAKTAFKTNSDEKDNRKFADEVVAFTKKSFELDAFNAFEFMQEYTPLIKGVMEYRSSLLALIEYKGFDQIDFLKIGNAYFLRITYTRQKPFDLLIPLIKGEGRVFKVEFDKKENLGVLKNKFYKFTLVETNWFPANEPANEEALKPLQVMDFFSKLDIKDAKVSADKAQAIYGYYYEKSADILKKDDSAEYEVWKKSVKSIFTIMSIMKDSIPAPVVKTEAPVTEPAPETVAVETAPVPAGTTPKAPIPVEIAPVDTTPVEAVEDPRIKLFQNFQDLKDAVEQKNKEYFGIEANVI